MLIASLLLSGAGLLLLFFSDQPLFSRQAISIVIGVVLFFVFRRVNTRMLQKVWWVWYAIVVVMLAVVFLGPEVRGSQRWVELLGERIQPSELMKPLYVVSLAGYVSLRKKFGLYQFLIFVGLFAVPFYLVFEEPDLGNAIVYLFTFLSILFISPFPLRYYILPVILLIAGVPLAWPLLEEYQKLRILTFVNPTYDIQGAGYNAYQALIAVGSGGWFGKGLGQGTQSNLSFLPEYHTDFVFAAGIEQVGFIGGLVLLLLYGCFLFAILNKGSQAESFSRLVAWGIFAQLLIQIIVNIGMNVGIIPITGITLPLISYGGSSIMGIFIGLGIISSITRQKHEPIAIR